MDPATLAATVVGTYLLPYVTKGAAALTAAVADKVGSAAANFATGIAGALWGKVKGAFSAEGDQFAIQEFEQHPEDGQKILERKLREKLEQDSGLLQELEQLISSADPEGRTAAQIIQNSGVMVNLQQADFRQAHDFNIVGAQYNPPGPPKPNRPGGGGNTTEN